MSREKLENLTKAMVEDILAQPDEYILTEAIVDLVCELRGRLARIIRECENLTSGAEEDRGHDTLMARFIAMAEGKPDNETP